jgi:hypothetical protein
MDVESAMADAIRKEAEAATKKVEDARLKKVIESDPCQQCYDRNKGNTALSLLLTTKDCAKCYDTLWEVHKTMDFQQRHGQDITEKGLVKDWMEAVHLRGKIKQKKRSINHGGARLHTGRKKTRFKQRRQSLNVLIAKLMQFTAKKSKLEVDNKSQSAPPKDDMVNNKTPLHCDEADDSNVSGDYSKLY